MAYKFNPLTGNLDYYEEGGSDDIVLEVLASDPTGVDGYMYINSSTSEVKLYYGGTWNVLHTLTPPEAFYLLMETGDNLLLETGDNIILE